MPLIPCILFEDRHLLAVYKPSGINTHQADEKAPWGMVEWILNHRTDLLKLGIHQRLDRETSGILLFAKSSKANRSLAEQFEKRRVRKTYLLVSRGAPRAGAHGTCGSPTAVLRQAQDGEQSRTRRPPASPKLQRGEWHPTEVGGLHPHRTFLATEPIEGKTAKTQFRFVKELEGGMFLWEAQPETGRTHQVRIHAPLYGIPIEGDAKESNFHSGPLLLHASKLELIHPESGAPLLLQAPMPGYFEFTDVQRRSLEAAVLLRQLLIHERDTNVYRLIHRKSDGFPNLTVDYLKGWLYVEDFGKTSVIAEDFSKWILDQSKHPLGCLQRKKFELKGLILSRATQGIRREDKRIIWGEPPPDPLNVIENGVQYQLDPLAPGGIGLFLDQRENRRRIKFLARGERILNLFAYTCGFSVAAAMGGATETINVDLSPRILEWGRRNFILNGLDPKLHHFLARDAMETLRKITSSKEQFGILVIDPPSFSRGKKGGHFSVKQDFEKMVQAAVPLVKSRGWLFCSSNLAEWKNTTFLTALQNGIHRTGRKMVETVWMPQPFDFPATAFCPTYLKSVWFRLE